jgi:hypothetical protein
MTINKKLSVFEFLFDRQAKKNEQITGEFMFTIEQGRVAAHRHLNPDGQMGGWVADTAYVDLLSFVHETALVYDNAKVLGRSVIYKNVKVCGDTVVNNGRR